MKIVKGNILSSKVLNQCDAICFTSNGIIKKNGRLTMGAGVAKAFRDRFFNIDWHAAQGVKKNGNICQVICNDETVNIVAFPTKHHWKNPSDIKLIEKSAKELVTITNKQNWESVALTKPGCSLGGLNWSDIKKLIEPIFDDRFTIYFL